MVQYVIWRLAHSLWLLFAVASLLFLLFHVAGVDSSHLLAGKFSDANEMNLLRKSLGVDRPILDRLLQFWSEVLALDFGRSWVTQESVNESIRDRLAPTLMLMTPGFLITFLFGVVWSSLPLIAKSSSLEKTFFTLASGLASVSSLIIIVAVQYLFTYYWPLFPAFGWPESFIEQIYFLILPWAIFFLIGFGSQYIWFHQVFKNSYESQFINVARAKGLSEWRLFFSHVLKSSSVLLASSFFYQIPFLLTGSILIESYFSIPGIGSLIAFAIRNADFPVIKAITIYVAALYLIVNILSDFVQVVLDPKVKF